MNCPFCLNADTKVVDSRVNNSDVRRRRECTRCVKRFTTYETAELEVTVIKKDSTTQPFDKQKIVQGLLNACHKRDVDTERIDAIARSIEHEVRSLGKLEVNSSYIGALVMRELLKVDKVAYLRFASVCKSFNDPKLFTKELDCI